MSNTVSNENKAKFSFKNLSIALLATILILVILSCIQTLIIKLVPAIELDLQVLQLINLVCWALIAIICAVYAKKLDSAKYDGYCCVSPILVFFCILLGKTFLFPFTIYGFLQIKAGNVPLKLKQ